MRLIRAFLFLTAASARNRFARQLRRMRRPRHLLPALAGLAYAGWVLYGGRGPGRAMVGGLLGSPATETVLALVVAGYSAAWWVLGADRWALAFTPAEVHFLFPAPISRRDVLQYKLLSSQLRVLAGVLIVGVLSNRGGGWPSPLLRGLALWTLLTTLHLHRLAASLVRLGALRHGRAGLRRNAVPIAIAGVAVAAVGWALVGAARGPDFGSDPFGALGRALDQPAAAAALAPFRLAVHPVAVAARRPSVATFMAALWPALVVLAAHYVWVLRSGVAFEDAAVEATAWVGERVASHRAAGGRRGPRVRRPRAGGWIPLAASGRPGRAIVWKNVLAAFRTMPLAPLLVILLSSTLAAGVLGGTGSFARAASALRTVGVGWMAALLLLGPQYVRNDLRQDLSQLGLLRSYPLPGRAIVAGQLGGSTAVLTVLGLPGLFVIYLSSLREPMPGGGLTRLALLAGAMLLLPAVNALALAVQNAIALIFPTLVRIGPNARQAGVEAFGQNMVLTALAVAFLLLLLTGPALAGGAAGWALRPLIGWWSAAPALAAALVVVAVELRLLVWWLGRLFEGLEPDELGAA